MAGRMKKDTHGGHPQKLGQPLEGEMRNLTVNEAIASDLTRGALVGTIAGRLYLFRSSQEHGINRRYTRLDPLSDSVSGLIAYWSESDVH